MHGFELPGQLVGFDTEAEAKVGRRVVWDTLDGGGNLVDARRELAEKEPWAKPGTLELHRVTDGDVAYWVAAPEPCSTNVARRHGASGGAMTEAASGVGVAVGSGGATVAELFAGWWRGCRPETHRRIFHLASPSLPNRSTRDVSIFRRSVAVCRAP